MKGTTLLFNTKPKGVAAKINSRAMGVRSFVTAAYKSDGDADDDKQALLLEIKNKVNSEFETKGFITKATALELFTESSKDLVDKNGKLELALKEQGEKMSELEKKSASQPADMSVRSQIAAYVEKNKDSIKNYIENGVRPDLPQMVIKAAHTMLLSTDAAVPVPYYLAQGAPLIDLVRIQPSFWQGLRKGRTSLPMFPWVNKTNKEGAAAFIGEGVLKPLASFQLTPEVSNPKKVAERMKMARELLYDIDGMTSLVENELRFEVDQAANTAVLTGTASATSPAGVLTIASAYNLTTVQTTNPTNADVIRAMAAQIRALGFTQQLTAYLNPIDIANMDMAKADTAGVYMFRDQYGRLLADIRVMEDNNIPVGNILVGAMDLYKILMYQDFFIEWGWENDDFSKNLITVIGEMRFHQYVSTNHLLGFVYESIADVKAAIDEAV